MENLSKTRFFAFIVGLAFLLTVIAIPRVSAGEGDYSVYFNQSDLIEDGAVLDSGNVARNDNVIIVATAGGGDIYRGWVVWNITSLTNVDVSNIYFDYHCTTAGLNVSITPLYINPDTFPGGAGGIELYNAIANAGYYSRGNTTGYPVIGLDQTIMLPANATADLQAAIDAGQEWFAIGFRSEQEGGNLGAASYIRTKEAPVPIADPQPTLRVTYNHTNVYTFPGYYYENGTIIGPPFNVSAFFPTAVSESFNVGGGVVEDFYEQPVRFSYVYGISTRVIYAFYKIETVYVFAPDDTYNTYSFEINDLVNRIGGNPAYLEAYREINATEILVERMIIQTPNTTPMNMVVGKTYRLKVLFSDGSRYDWGYFVAGADTSNTITIRTVEFGDKAQVLYNYIHVDADRTTGLITMDYLDDRDNTIWANISIRIRNGAVVQTYTRSNSSYTINYAGFNDSLGYIVTFTGKHSDCGVWGRTFILDQSFTFPDGPDLGGIFGALDNLIPFLLVCVTILVFPVSLQPIGLLGGGVMALILSFIGWASWSYDLLAFYWFIAIVIVLVVRGRGT